MFYLLWQIAQPLLFGLIGAELDVHFIEPSLIGKIINESTEGADAQYVSYVATKSI